MLSIISGSLSEDLKPWKVLSSQAPSDFNVEQHLRPIGLKDKANKTNSTKG